MFSIYKRGQGKWIRLVAAVGLLLLAFFLCRRMYLFLDDHFWVFRGRPAAITTGPDGICNTVASAGVEYKIATGNGKPNSVAVLAGPDNSLETLRAGDDVKEEDDQGREIIGTGEDGTADSRATGDDVQVIEVGRGEPFAVCIYLKGGGSPSEVVPGGDDTELAGWPKLTPFAVALIGLGCLWGIFKVVNHPRRADFLIETEGEMKKVSWPGKSEVVGATGVVIITVLLLAALLFASDTVVEVFIRKVIRLF